MYVEGGVGYQTLFVDGTVHSGASGNCKYAGYELAGILHIWASSQTDKGYFGSWNTPRTALNISNILCLAHETLALDSFVAVL